MNASKEFKEHFRYAYQNNSSFRFVLKELVAYREQLKEQAIQQTLPENVYNQHIGAARLIAELNDLTAEPKFDRS